MKLQDIKIIIGLGNPGKEYEKTYHNIGILFIEYLMNKMPPISNFQFLISKPLKTNVYMNQSGAFVVKAIKKYHIKTEELLIVHDDSDIELGKYKISFDRGSAGHNGVESIIKSLKTKDFWRLRIGIRPSVDAEQRGLTRRITQKKASEMVLKKINKKDLEILTQVFTKASLNLKN